MTAYERAIDADIAWQTALETRYGRRATDARYDARGEATEELRTLKAAKLQADAEHYAELRTRRHTREAR